MGELTKVQQDRLVRDQVRNIDLFGRRIINAGNAKNLQDYVTKVDLNAAIASVPTGGGYTSFSDDFSRTTLGSNWAVGYGDGIAITPVISLDGSTISFKANGSGTAANLRVTPLLAAGVNDKDQYAQIKYVSGTVNADIGPAVGTSDVLGNGAANGYFASCRTSLSRVDLYRANKVESTLLTNVCSLAGGDTIKITLNFVLNANVIKIYRNGALQTTYTDNSSGPINGIPAIYWAGSVVGTAVFFDDFACGTL